MPDVQTEFTGGRNQPPGQGDWVNSVSVVLGAVIVLIALAFAYDLEILRTLEIPKEQALPIVLGSAFFARVDQWITRPFKSSEPFSWVTRTCF